MSGRLVNFSAIGTRMLLTCAVQPGSMVKVDWGGTLLLGEIIYCTPEGSEYAVGLELEDVLYETEMLQSLSDTWAAPTPRSL